MSAQKARHIAIMDTTLRDGEQTPGIAYTPSEKLHVAKMLLTDVGVDRIEIASARVSEGEHQAARRIMNWADESGYADRVEMLGFCDVERSADWILAAGGRVMNLLTKGSEQHCRNQLQATPEEHVAQIAATVAYARSRRLVVNAYLEDWSNGVRESYSYVELIVEALKRAGVEHVFLADTLGVLAPAEVSRYVALMTSAWPTLQFDFHGHNDYGLATANALAAIEAGAAGVHTSVNGLGERAGNTSLAEIVAVISDHTEFTSSVDESRLAAISTLVETFSGKNIAANTPILGTDVFTQTAGVHADGDAKGGLYVTRLAPQRFGRERRYALGKLSGKASLDHNLEKLGITLSAANRKQVLDRIIELGDKKHTVVPEDLLMIIADVLKSPSEHGVRIARYSIRVDSDRPPEARVAVSFHGKIIEKTGTGDGGYDALMNALKEAVSEHGIRLPRLADYRVRIPPGGRTEALVETLIRWDPEDGRSEFTTLGVDSDQTAAAVIATEKMLNVVALEQSRARPGLAAPAEKH
ncbi:MAG TPA: alpha-isopropylmalate synthase regulatory domain-containing protein [Gammaproteobacteria bacterium]|nr:alpha-isopropylmalate synthase regulatory domain-containing protein [Gammaproteobacteria bacterium]